MWPAGPERGHMKNWLLLSGAILTEVAGSLGLKAATSDPWFYLLVVTGYSCAFALLGAVLRGGMKLGVAYGVWGASGVALTAVLSWAIFAEPLTWIMMVGIVLIVGGVLLVEMGSGSHGKAAAERAAEPATEAGVA